MSVSIPLTNWIVDFPVVPVCKRITLSDVWYMCKGVVGDMPITTLSAVTVAIVVVPVTDKELEPVLVPVT